MPILTKPSVSKGSPASFTLNKALLAAIPTDPYFQDTANWYRVILKYESSVGGQREKVLFDASQASPVGSFLMSIHARDPFQIKEIVIYDFDGGYYSIPRASLTASEFDVVLQAPSNPALAILSSSFSVTVNGDFDWTLNWSAPSYLDNSFTYEIISRNDTDGQPPVSLGITSATTFNDTTHYPFGARVYYSIKTTSVADGSSYTTTDIGFQDFA